MNLENELLRRYFLNILVIFPEDLFLRCTKKMKISNKDFFNKCDQNPQFSADLVTFTE